MDRWIDRAKGTEVKREGHVACRVRSRFHPFTFYALLHNWPEDDPYSFHVEPINVLNGLRTQILLRWLQHAAYIVEALVFSLYAIQRIYNYLQFRASHTV